MVKRAVEAGHKQGFPLEHTLATFLLSYRTSPHATTGVAPSTLLQGRHLRTRLDLLKPDIGRKVRSQQSQQKAQHDLHSRGRQFDPGQLVFVRNRRDGPRWIRGSIIRIQGPVSYLVRVSTGDVWRQHIDDIRDGCHSPQMMPRDRLDVETSEDGANAFMPDLPQELSSPLDDQRATPEAPPVSSSQRYPQRVRRPPVRYGQ